jgi:hypothetical protein
MIVTDFQTLPMGKPGWQWGLAIVAVLLFAVLTPVWATFGPHCRCGHHRRVHAGRHTECDGYWRAGRNAVGAQQFQPCPCARYRPTGVGYWRRVLHGTEERSR